MTSTTSQSMRFYQRASLAILLTGCVGAFAWSALASISGAVVAPAKVAVEGSSKKVQHLEGGIVSEVRFKNGDQVKQGDVIIRLDDTEARATLQILKTQLSELKARHARLVTERDDGAVMEVPKDENVSTTVWTAQFKLLKARRDVREGKKQQLSERISQLEEGTAGLAAQVDSKDRQIALIRKELDSVYELRDARLVTQNRWLALEREAARLEGERGQLVADIARLKVQVGETRLQLIGIDQSFLSEVLEELRDVETKIAELTEKVTAITARLQLMEITAPTSGFVHKLTATTRRGVIAAGDVVAEIVPDEHPLILEARVDPGSIDRLQLHQATIVRFPAFHDRSTSEMEGEVTMISPDAKQDAPGQAPYYLVHVSPTNNKTLAPGGHVLKPGMPAELLFKTGDRSILSFLVRPLTDQMARAMRER